MLSAATSRPLVATPAEPPTLTRHQLAEKLRVSVGTVDRRIKDGTIPSIRMGGRLVRIPAAWLDELLAKGDAR
jgi:excisionase family DNA binding protein